VFALSVTVTGEQIVVGPEAVIDAVGGKPMVTVIEFEVE
jgi:hypothetical protein